MNAKKHEKITVILFVLFLTAMMIMYLFLPKAEFSITEKRYLEQFPQISWNDISSGKWGDSLEKYMADHIPGRNFWVGLNAYVDLYTGRQETKDVYIVDGRLVEAPADEDNTSIELKVNTINAFAASIETEVDFMLIPSAGWATGSAKYSDDDIVRRIYSATGTEIQTLDMLSVYDNEPELYYSTDHHWTSEGAYQAYTTYCQAVGKKYAAYEDFEIEAINDFHGSTYSRSALWLTPAETLEIWNSDSNITVTNGESEETNQSVFYRDRLAEADKYTVYLDGNHSIVRTYNPEGNGKLLVIRDSFANCLGCFLAESYEEVILVDLRYYKQPISQLAKEEAFERVLICYSLNNFLTDSNLIFLK